MGREPDSKFLYPKENSGLFEDPYPTKKCAANRTQVILKALSDIIKQVFLFRELLLAFKAYGLLFSFFVFYVGADNLFHECFFYFFRADCAFHRQTE